MRLRRFEEHLEVGFPKMLDPWHPALSEGRTLYPKRRVTAGRPDRLLKSGQHSRKLGAVVQKGAWRGMPIYTLTLEERATCPRTCKVWSTCFGNSMNFAERIEHGPELEEGLDVELRYLARQHRRGFVARLHVLGDFYSVAYVKHWACWLALIPQLHVFGYTAWQPDTEIGAAVRNLRTAQWDRFAVRTSGAPAGEPRTVVLPRVTDQNTIDGAIVCPAQSGRSACCATCALCWSTKRDIAFMPH